MKHLCEKLIGIFLGEYSFAKLVNDHVGKMGEPFLLGMKKLYTLPIQLNMALIICLLINFEKNTLEKINF
jgi:hypothetical protein